MFSTKELIIFDMDGTLIDSAPSLSYALNKSLELLNLPQYELQTIRQWIGNGADILIKRAIVGDFDYEKFPIDKKQFTKLKKLFLEIYGANLNTNAKLYDGVDATLNKLSQNYTLALATNKPVEFVTDILAYFKIDHYFTLCLGAGSVEKKKPHPQMLLTICEKLAITPPKAVMVGDSQNDILAANAANIECIALTYGYNQGTNLQQLQPARTCNTFSEIEAYFSSDSSKKVIESIQSSE